MDPATINYRTDLRGPELQAIVSHIMRQRRSHYPKHFTGERIEDTVIESILDNANTAPNHKSTYPWRFKVFSDRSKDDIMDFMLRQLIEKTAESENKILKIKAFPEKIKNTSHLLAIVVHYDLRKRVPEVEETMAVACAVQNIYLSLAPYNVGGYWSTGHLIDDRETYRKLHLAANERLLGFFYLGKLKPELLLPKREIPVQTIEWIK